MEHARQRIAELKHQVDDDPGEDTLRRQAAKARAAREREERVQAALDRLPELTEIKQRQGKAAEDARASSTDAEATVMKMGDGGFRPAYNVPYSTNVDSQMIVGVVTTERDQGQLDAVAERTEVLAPVPKAKVSQHDQAEGAPAETIDPHTPKAGDSPAVAAW